MKKARIIKNERDTENIVRDALTALGYKSSSNDIQVDEQKSNIDSIRGLLKNASKTGKGGVGFPEFIISRPKQPDFLIIVECKADKKRHASEYVDSILKGELSDQTLEEKYSRVSGFAADGVLHYASHLASEYNVIALAVSGDGPDDYKVETFLHSKGAKHPKRLLTKGDHPALIEKFLSWDEYIEHATFDPTIQRLRHSELMAFSRELHEFMRDYAKLTESEKPLLVSGTLLALRNVPFSKTYPHYDADDLQKEWIKAIEAECQKVGIPESKKLNMAAPYASLASHPELGRLPLSDPRSKIFPRGVLFELVKLLNDKVWPFISVYHNFDVVGQFYGEFLKYTGGDKKALGIVLTPRHITELFAELANVNSQSKVLDICAGTGGFLISAMQRMMSFAGSEQDKANIKSYQLIGVEQQPHMFALAASNMILRGDGRANLHLGSCFDEGIGSAILSPPNANESPIAARKCDTGFINPPYAQGDKDLHELMFVKHMLSLLEVGGAGIAIVPMGCAISPHQIKEEILRHHTLEAVMSMPDSLFHPVGTVTCIMVFTAHKPHTLSDKETWFGFWKDDGFLQRPSRRKGYLGSRQKTLGRHVP